MATAKKDAIIPYEPFFVFVNTKITESNYTEALETTFAHPGFDKLGKFQSRYVRLGVEPAYFLEGKFIDDSSQPVLRVQNEIKKDLTRLTDPTQDFVLPAPPPDPSEPYPNRSPEQEKELRHLASQIKEQVDRIKKEPVKDLNWLLQKIRSRISEDIPFRLSFVKKNNHDNRLQFGDEVYLHPAIKDLRIWAYFLLANLWADGLLQRIGLCKTCKQFFLAKTEKKNRQYCSQRCAQRITAAERTKASRVRRATWDSIREDLKTALQNENLRSVEKILRKAQEAFVAAYPRQKGPGYEEGKTLLTRAEKQVQRLKKAKGH